MQRLLDNPFLLLFIGVTVPAVFYIVWGLMEITQMPIARRSCALSGYAAEPRARMPAMALSAIV